MIITNNKQIRGAYIQYQNSSNGSLNDVYKKYSHRKKSGYEYCVKLMNEYHGSDLRILSYSTYEFTVGFIGYIENKKYFFYITRDYDRAMQL